MEPQRATWRRYWETVRHLQAEQILFQLWRPLQPWVWPRSKHLPEAARETPDWGWRTRRPHGAADASFLEGRFRFWGVERHLDLDREWSAPDLGSSWNFPLHYFDALATVAADRHLDAAGAEALRQHIETWLLQHDVERGDAWHPYTTSLRVVNWLDALTTLRAGASDDWTREVLRSLVRQIHTIPPQLERHLLGTHLLKNLKAVLVGTAVFDDPTMRRHRGRALELFARELQAQVHPDGGHMEPSAMYHCMATGDLLDLLNFKGALPDEAMAPTRQVAARMLAYAAAVQTPAGGYPLQGDSWNGGEWTPVQLLDYGARLGIDVPSPSVGLTFLPDSGVLVWRRDPSWLFADVAPVGPPHLPSHGHCDSLSFEWSVKGMPLIVDSGTFSYEDGPLRHACRSTAAHNTVQIDAQEQHEIWSRFRVARRSRVQAERRDDAEMVEAVLRPWADRALCVRRRFHFDDACIQIDDAVEGDGEHAIVSRVHLHPACRVQRVGEALRVQRNGVQADLVWEGGELEVLTADQSDSRYAEEAGVPVPNAVVVLRHQGPLPFASRLVLRVV